LFFETLGNFFDVRRHSGGHPVQYKAAGVATDVTIQVTHSDAIKCLELATPVHSLPHSLQYVGYKSSTKLGHW
jgi:hypothetical protein